MSEARYYEDIVLGEVRQSSTRVISREEMLEFAQKYDPQYFHADPELACASSFGELIASGLHTAALWRMLDHQISGDIRWICGVAWKDVRWPTAVRAGDTLQASYQMLDKRLSQSDPRRGVVECEYRLQNQHDETVFVCRSINLIERRTPAATDRARS